MRERLMAAATGLLLLWGSACAPSYQVRTMASPDAGIGGVRTFRVLPVPPPRDRPGRDGAYDPMIDNSIMNRALRATITESFKGRGYAIDEWRPDFIVAVYASAYEELDVTVWDYGYPYWPRWRYGPWPPERVTTYTAGTVIVDVLSPASRDLLWRGTGTARMSEHLAADTKELRKVAEAIVKRFPRAAERVLASTH